MIIKPVAFDSLGTRGMATYVETKDVKLFIDPGVALAPWRNGYPPHPIELERQEKQWQEITKLSKGCEVLIITHYHYDHHNPNHPELYDGKVALVKHPEKNINKSGFSRAKFFLPKLRPKRLEYCDGNTYKFGSTRLVFSKAVFHGTNSKLGYVVEVLVDDGETRFVHTSDVEGPAIDEQIGFVLKSKPNIVFVDGPMTYMLGYRYSHEHFEQAKANLMRILKECPIERLVLEHHLLRDIKWREKMAEVLAFGGNKVCCAAEFIGKVEDVLENKRKQLYQQHPVR
ncbi:hypothetical protein DRJ48_04030 [Candidatus Woesearchaeota archaeon]|nr:hypothetical protein [Candidatus Woesearchaeota archaeon]RLE42202.1 MAG: hypothetical protein DRJ48_04030 [Candidatus Woesearchaeota archaeon]